MLTLLLAAWIGWRFFNPWIASAAVWFLAVCVSELGMARRAWQDSFFGFVSLLLVCVTCEIVRNRRRVWLYPLFFAVGGYCLLTKESGIVSYVVCAVCVVVALGAERDWKALTLFVTGAIASLGAGLALWGVLAGGLGPSFVAVQVTRAHHLDPGGYAALYTSGPWYQFFYLEWIAGPVSAALAVVGTLATVFRGRVAAGWGASALVAVFAWSFLAAAAFVPGYQSLRVTAPADGACALLAALGLWSLLDLARRIVPESDYRTLVLVVAVAVVILGVRNYRTFRSVVADSGMEDLAVSMIRGAMGR